MFKLELELEKKKERGVQSEKKTPQSCPGSRPRKEGKARNWVASTRAATLPHKEREAGKHITPKKRRQNRTKVVWKRKGKGEIRRINRNAKGKGQAPATSWRMWGPGGKKRGERHDEQSNNLKRKKKREH